MVKGGARRFSPRFSTAVWAGAVKLQTEILDLMAKIHAGLEQLAELLPTLAYQYHRLILVVGPHGTGKTRLLTELSRHAGASVPYLNVNLALSERLLDLTTKERPLRIRRLLAEIIDEHQADTLALDNIELLFEPTLHQDPLVLLQGLSRNKSLIVAWGGTYDERRRVLTYAEPGHPEYRRYERPEVMVITLSQQ